MIKKLIKYISIGTITSAFVYQTLPQNIYFDFSFSFSQGKENMKGACKSILNSSRAAYILYKAIKDYEVSLDKL